MNTDKPTILMTEGSDPAPRDWLAAHSHLIEAAPGTPAFEAAAATAQGLCVRTYTKVNAQLLDRMPALRCVGRGGVGIENIDVAECRRRGVEVVYTPDANTLAVGDFVIGYLLQLLRPWCFFSDRAYAPQEFKKIRDTVRGRQLNELTFGILGMGRVGRRLGGILARGFGAKVLYHDVQDVAAHVTFPATSVDRATLLSSVDVLSLHIDSRPGNKLTINASALAQMKPGAVLVNTSRGDVLDAHALAAALASGHLYAAALDVFDPEPPKDDFPLLALPPDIRSRVLLTPHLAARTDVAMENMSWVVRDVLGVIRGEAPLYPAPR